MDAFTRAVKHAERVERARIEQEYRDLSCKLGDAVKVGTVTLPFKTVRVWRLLWPFPPIPFAVTTKVVFWLSDSVYETECFTTDGEGLVSPGLLPVWTRSRIGFLTNEQLQETIDRMRQLLEPRRPARSTKRRIFLSRG